jgi:hypothetical protein
VGKEWRRKIFWGHMVVRLRSRGVGLVGVWDLDSDYTFILGE